MIVVKDRSSAQAAYLARRYIQQGYTPLPPQNYAGTWYIFLWRPTA